MIIAGYEVPHAHIHVIPTNHMGEMSFANAAIVADAAELATAAAAIKSAMKD